MFKNITPFFRAIKAISALNLYQPHHPGVHWDATTSTSTLPTSRCSVWRDTRASSHRGRCRRGAEEDAERGYSRVHSHPWGAISFLDSIGESAKTGWSIREVSTSRVFPFHAALIQYYIPHRSPKAAAEKIENFRYEKNWIRIFFFRSCLNALSNKKMCIFLLDHAFEYGLMLEYLIAC